MSGYTDDAIVRHGVLERGTALPAEAVHGGRGALDDPRCLGRGREDASAPERASDILKVIELAPTGRVDCPMPHRPKTPLTALALSIATAATLSAQPAPTLPAETLLDRAILKALDEELSGVAAKDHVARLTQLHRVPASPGFHDAIEYVMDRARRRSA